MYTAFLAVLIIFGTIVFSNSIVNAESEGWVYSNNMWTYYQDGAQVQEGWVKDGKGWGYIQKGCLVQEGWVKDDQGWSYIQSGYLVQEGWVKDSKGWGYLQNGCLMQEGWVSDSEGLRYIKDGYLMQEGWAKDSKGWRYIKDGLLVQEGWARDSNGWGYIQNGYLRKASMWAVDSKGWQHIDNSGYWDGQTIGAVAAVGTPAKPTDNVSGNIKISFIDVGQAESILIQQGSYTMLIDAGYDTNAASVKDYISQQGINQLDYVIASHPHEDHIGGLSYILNSFKIGKIFMPKATDNTQAFEDFMSTVKNKNMTITTPVPGSTFKLGEAVCTVLGPVNTDVNDLNTYSIVIKITYGKNSFLLTGDAVESNEVAMIDAGYDVSADVLKVGHHGVYTSTSQVFLDKVNPKYAVISVGKGNLNGPPAPEVLTRLFNKEISTFRTDMNGTIVCTSDGNNITFNMKPVDLAEILKLKDIQITNMDLNRIKHNI